MPEKWNERGLSDFTKIVKNKDCKKTLVWLLKDVFVSVLNNNIEFPFFEAKKETSRDKSRPSETVKIGYLK